MIFAANYESLDGIERIMFNIQFNFLKQIFSGPTSVKQQMSVKSLNLLKYRLRTPNNYMSEIAINICEAIFSSKTFTKSAIKKRM